MPNAERVFFVRHTLLTGFIVEENSSTLELTAGFGMQMQKHKESKEGSVQ